MGAVRKIFFPYLIDFKVSLPVHERMVVFFGTNFLGPALPIGWNDALFIERTNAMLSYIREHFCGYRLIYQPHPNETNETDYFDMIGFTVGETTVAELFLYTNAPSIEYVFSACSNASASAYAMGLNAGVFLDTLGGVIPDESMRVYHGYFAGLPENFFIRSFTDTPRWRAPYSLEGEHEGLARLREALDKKKRLWFLCADPALALRAAIIIRALKKNSPHIEAGLIQIHHRRWDLLSSFGSFLQEFSTVIELPLPRAWYSVRFSKILHAFRVARSLRHLDIRPDDVLVSFSNLLFEENCLLSFYPRTEKILIIENRWFDFVYEKGYELLPASSFYIPWGVYFFNYLVELPLKLHRTIFNEFTDKTVNIFRYEAPLDQIYNAVFVLMPAPSPSAPPIVDRKTPHLFERLIVSGFGWKKLKRLTLGRVHRSRLISQLQSGEVLNTRRSLQLLLDAPALINDPEVLVLQRYGRTAPQTIVEIGAAYGGSSLLFLYIIQPHAHLFSIDPFVVDSMGDFQATQKLCTQRVTHALTDCGIGERLAQWTLIPKYSYDVVSSWKQPIDLLFIDGDHRYEAVRKDFEDWFSFVTTGGFIMFHDSCKSEGADPNIYDHGWDGPSDLVRELVNDTRLSLVEQTFSLSVFKKSL